jgi:hypothetical protein
MSNFVSTFKAGKEGKNFGIPTGIAPLDESIHGIQKKYSYGIVAAEKVGKTTLNDFAFVLNPYLYMEKAGKLDNVEWIYNSYEIDRISKEFKFAAFFMYHDFGQATFRHQDKIYGMCQDYLMGKFPHRISPTETELVPISEEHEAMLKEIYVTRIVPMFGEYDEQGRKVSNGKIDFIEETDNPTGVYKYLMNYATQNGEFIRETYYTTDDHGHRVAKSRITGYTPRNPDKYTIIVTDHIRKFKPERGFTKKENIDKWLEYSTWLRNLCSFTFVNISHSNRGIANVERLKFAGEFVFPTADDVKDSGNLGEESTILLTMFNPNDEKYNLKKHFNVELVGYPNYRSIHVVSSRYTECPVHIQTNMLGGINYFTSLNFK